MLDKDKACSINATLSVIGDRWTLAFVGRYDYKRRADFDAAGLGKMFSNVLGLSLGIAASNGLGTFCSQAHGANRHDQLPLFFWRCC